MGAWPVRYLGSAVKQKLVQRVQALPVCITPPLVLSHSDFCSCLVVAEICFLSLSLLFFQMKAVRFGQAMYRVHYFISVTQSGWLVFHYSL